MNLLKKIGQKSILFILTIFFCNGIFGQDGYYAGLELGFLSGRYHYINDRGYSMSQGGIGNQIGAHFGKRKSGFYFQTGLYRCLPLHPISDIDYDTSEPTKSIDFIDAIENYMISFSLGKELKISKRFYAGIGIGLSSIVARDIGEIGVIGMRYYDPNQPLGTLSGDSTMGVVSVDRRINFGLESAFKLSFRSKGHFDYFLKAGYMAHFRPFSNDVITHYSDSGTISAHRVGLNWMNLAFGLSYRFRNRADNPAESTF